MFDALRERTIDAALITPEGLITYGKEGFHPVVDLAGWWSEITGGLPLPLSGYGIQRDLDIDTLIDLSEILYASISHALEHRDEAIKWLLERGGPLHTYEDVSAYLDRYATHHAIDHRESGRTAVEIFLEQGAALGLFPEAELDWAP